MIRILSIGLLIFLNIFFPILLFPSAGPFLIWSIYALYLSFQTTPKKMGIGKGMIWWLAGCLSSPIFGFYLFGQMFAGEDFSYYLSYPIIIFLTIFFWIFLNKSPWGKKRLKIISLAAILICTLSLLSLWGLRNNPTVFLHSETVKLNGKKKTYSNTDILILLKKVEQLIVLDILNSFDGIEEIEFLSVRENPNFRQPGWGGNRFSAQILINHQYEITYDFNLSYDEDDYEPSFLSSSSYTEEFIFKAKDQPSTIPITIDDLNQTKYQQMLKQVKVKYYIEHDIYKDE